jgi:hypothetical protein
LGQLAFEFLTTDVAGHVWSLEEIVNLIEKQ